MRKIIGLFLIFLSFNGFAWTQRPPQDPQTCKVHAPYGFPQTAGIQPICRQASYRYS